MELTNKQLLQYLKSLQFNSGFIDKLKIYYRPLVCPFADLIKTVKGGDKVADIGCGSGQFCLLLSNFSKPSFIYGIEISDRLIKNAQQLFSKYSNTPNQFEYFDGISFPEKIGEMDVIFLNDVLHHVPKNIQVQFMKSLLQKMKSGSRIVLKDIDRSSPFVYFNKMHDLIFAGETGNELKYSDAIQLLENNQTEITETIKKRMYVYPHYIIIAQKK